MKLEDQVVSLELAKRLKELGVKQESFFYWDGQLLRPAIYAGDGHNLGVPLSDKIFAAFTVAELGEILPDHSYAQKRDDGYWECGYHLALGKIAKTEADARAKMLIYLLEQGLVKP